MFILHMKIEIVSLFAGILARIRRTCVVAFRVAIPDVRTADEKIEISDIKSTLTEGADLILKTSGGGNIPLATSF